jgi:hypothetical protein
MGAKQQFLQVNLTRLVLPSSLDFKSATMKVLACSELIYLPPDHVSLT